MKPINTSFDGYYFRSRLEAKWAVFFKALGLNYSYEKEGYKLNNGDRYLPDFYIKDWDAFIEIKADKPTAEEIKKCAELNLNSGKLVLLIYGNKPWPGSYKIKIFDKDENYFEDGIFLQCRRCEGLYYAVGEGEYGDVEVAFARHLSKSDVVEF